MSADVAIGASGASRAYIYFGGAAGVGTIPATTLGGPNGNEFGGTVASAGDVNGDGYADVVVCESGNPDERGAGSAERHAYVYLGSAFGLGTSATRLTGAGGWGWFSSAASAGDVNGDGYADLVVGSAYDAQPFTGAVYLYQGSASGLVTTQVTRLAGPDGEGGYFGGSVAGAGDVNGDGYADIVVGADRRDHVFVYLGSAAGVDARARTTFSEPDRLRSYFGHSVASAGDVNGDGFADIAVGASVPGSYTGTAYVYLWDELGVGFVNTTRLPDPDPGGFFGHSVAGAGDVDVDGYADVVVGAFLGSGAFRGSARVCRGSAAGLLSTPATTVTGPDGEITHFGWSVARTGNFGDARSPYRVSTPRALLAVTTL